MYPQLNNWKASLSMMPSNIQLFDKRFFVAVSKVLFAGKPSELICLGDKKLGLEREQEVERARYLSTLWGLCAHSLYEDRRSCRILIWERVRVSQVLETVGSTPFFINLGYSRSITPKSFIREIKFKWEKSGEMPHEIGVVLGYPIKDVVGFMGLSAIEYQETSGWKIYGRLEPSLELKEKYDRGKKIAFEFLQETPQGIFAPNYLH